MDTKEIRTMHVQSQAKASLRQHAPEIRDIIDNGVQTERDRLIAEACLCYLLVNIYLEQHQTENLNDNSK